MPADFTALLEQHLQARKLSLRAFAEAVGMHFANVHKVAQGNRKPPLDRIELWARELGLKKQEAEAFVLAAHLAHATDLVREYVRKLEG